MFFNVNLFQLNGAPLKFYLDGYVYPEINKIASIVEAFGGVLSPPADDTIIFSEPGICTTGDYCRFHIKFFYDCIVARKLQDLDKYKLPTIANLNEFGQTEPGPEDEEASVLFAGDKLQSEDTPSNVERSSEATVNEDGANEDSSSTNEACAVRIGKRAKRKRSEMSEASDSSTVEKFDHLNISSGTQSPPKESSLFKEVLEELSAEPTNGIHWSKEEDEKLLLYLISKSAPAEKVDSVWEEVEADTMFTKTQCATASQSQGEKKLETELQKPVEQSKVVDQPKKDKFAKKRYYGNQYTDDENKKIIDYLIQHDKINVAGGNIVWRQMVADRILVNPRRTAVGLLNHFVTNLQHNYKKYTTSEEALRKFRQRSEKRRNKQLQRANRTI